MNILGFNVSFANRDKESPTSSAAYSQELFSIYDGEKNSGELGNPVKYHLDYHGLRLRSWESYLSSEITQTVVKRFAMWVIGSGLKLQSEPIINVLEENNIKPSPDLTKSIENRFRIFANSSKVDYSERKNLHQIAKTAYINSIVGGDVLVVLRTDEDLKINIQLIDGANVVQPYMDKHLSEAENRGNTVVNGEELDKRGRIVSFYVKKNYFEVERLLSKNPKTGREMAFMVYGLEYRISDNRGLPLFSAVLETLKKLERYKEAVVGSAEERQKIPFYIKHGLGSTGESPIMSQVAKAFDIGGDELPHDSNGQQFADNVAASMNKRVYNMPQDSELQSLESKSELNYNDFYSPNVNSICATIGMPPEVALSKYEGSFSSARAAIKDWEHTLLVNRKDFSTQFYDKIYEYWLDIEVLKHNIQAEGYLTSLAKGNEEVLAAYRNSRFVGANVPHIDPVKEVLAERMKLGDTGKDLPLTTAESATEALNGGEFDTNLSQYSTELKKSKEFGVKSEPKGLPENNNENKEK